MKHNSLFLKLLVLQVVLFYFRCGAQEIEWQNTIGGNNSDYFTSIQQTADGGYILGGYSGSGISGDKTENVMGINDYWIVKTDSLGNILWQNTIGGSNYDRLMSIQQTTDGGYILGGNSDSNISGDKTENSWFNSVDYWIVKTDSLGNILWQNTIGGNDFDYLNSVQQTADGGYILGGYSESNISGDKTENLIGINDYWIVKTDSLGNIMWQNTIGGNGTDYLYSVQQTADEGYILGGWSNSNISGDKTENIIWDGDYWIVKIDSHGSIQWQNTIGGNDPDYIYSIQQTADGGYILGGQSTSNISDDKTENCIGNYDYWIVKLTNKYNYITGIVYGDFNNNSVNDGGEPAFKNKMITELHTGRIGFSNNSGDYNIAVLGTGIYTVQAAAQYYYSSMPLNYNALFTAFQQTDSLNDFAFQPTGLINDLCVTITPTGQFRSGFNASYNITYSNVGTNTINNCQLVFYLDTTVVYVSSSRVPSLIFADSIVWNIDSILPFQERSITVTVQLDAGMPIGTFINCWTRFFPLAGDANIANNSAAYEVFTTGSYDPNDILVNRSTLLTTEILTPPFLEYTIRFQNTGNDTAFFVKILNPLDTAMLQLSTFEVMATSHTLTGMQFIYHERNMEFNFENILLPDSNVNEPLSHGFVRYRIKPKNILVVNDQIQNLAVIYFDFNAPVITDTAITTVVTPVFVQSPTATSSGLRIFPNPVSDKVIIRGAENEIRITDSFGRVVYESTIRNHSEDITLDVQKLDKGVYVVDSRGSRARFVKQ